jgi:phage terminase large subunit-like protein
MTRGETVCKFIEAFCLIPEGSKVGQPFKLLDFQRKFVLDVYDNPEGTSRAYLSVARKNGKSALIAAIVLAHLVGPEAKQNSQIISGARSRDQAALVFKLAVKMVRLSSKRSKIERVIPSQKSLVGLLLNVEYKAISAEARTAHGLSPTLAPLDEVGQVRGPHDPFVEAIETAQVAHLHPLLIVISTQAATDGDLFSLWLDDAANSADPRIVSHLYTAPKDCEITDRKAWAAANPAMAQFRSQTDIEDFAAQAERLPAKANSFRWLYLNQRIEAQSPFLSRAEWEANNASPEVVPGDHCFAGLDLSASRDLTALVLVFPKADKYHVLPHFFSLQTGCAINHKQRKLPMISGPTKGT